MSNSSRMTLVPVFSSCTLAGRGSDVFGSRAVTFDLHLVGAATRWRLLGVFKNKLLVLGRALVLGILDELYPGRSEALIGGNAMARHFHLVGRDVRDTGIV